ncbi:DNA adenine methylase [Lactovum odontotermitis]
MVNKVNSPLRYPGGKSKLTTYVEHLLDINDINGTYIEPFAGGAGIAINLILSGRVEKIVINDLDVSVFSFWYHVKNNPQKLINKIKKVPFSTKGTKLSPEELIEYWDITKRLYLKSRGSNTVDEAFTFFMLNRMNISGIISGGPIGGRKQNGEYNVTVRFNKDDLIKRIEKIAEFGERIIVQNLDAVSFIQNVINSSIITKNSFLFVDPPYFFQGRNLYPSYIDSREHNLIANILQSNPKLKWIETYDMSKQISDYYSTDEVNKYVYNLQYSAMRKRKASELMFSSKNINLESFDNVQLQRLEFNEVLL